MTARSHHLQWPEVTARVAAGIFGAYAFTWALTAAGVAALVGLGVPYHDAEMGMIMLAFLVFLGLFLWSFIATRIGLVWVALFSGASMLQTASWCIQRALLS